MTSRSEVLREVMLETDTTQSGLSRLSGVRQPSISGFLSGRVDLSDDQLDRLLSCMGFRLEVVRRPFSPNIQEREVIVVGSQAILGTYDESQLPAAATMSIEVDILPIADSNEETARLADLIEGIAGEFSPFRGSDRRGSSTALGPTTAASSERTRGTVGRIGEERP
jgi:predicted transcriptional regulator